VRQDADATASLDHAVHRYREGFNVNQVISEYRALRASVTRLWLSGGAPLPEDHYQELIRFNEAIDQLVAESVDRFSREVDASRELFLGSLGHDLRAPLSAIHTTMTAWSRDPGPRANDKVRADRVLRAAERMRVMVSDLLDFTRTQRGSRLPINPEHCDAGTIFKNAVDEVQASTPVDIQFNSEGDLSGMCDCARLGQLASNLVGNAATHGSRDEPIRVSLTGVADAVHIRVHNSGGELTEAEQRSVFQPLMRGPKATSASQGLGLGLYICKQIAEAHGGTIALKSSSDAGTEVRVSLPRSQATSHA
jgi:signal transduction histidine kinase